MVLRSQLPIKHQPTCNQSIQVFPQACAGWPPACPAGGVISSWQVRHSESGATIPVLQQCGLPSLEDMIEESLFCNRTYKYSGFHDVPGAPAGVGDAAAAAAAAQAKAKAAQGGERREGPAGDADAKQEGKDGSAGGANMIRKAGIRQRVAEAAAAEAAGATPLVSKARHAGGTAMRRKQAQEKQAGVLFVGEAGEINVS